MKRAIGPFDRRIKRTRCAACIKGHLKCEGGTPCKYCIRTQQTCTSADVSNKIVFLEPIGKVVPGSPIDIKSSCFMPRSLSPDGPAVWITHFHTSFLRSNSITGSSVEEFPDVHPLLHKSHSLQYAVMAVSALDFGKQGRPLHGSAQRTALQYYRASISSVQADLAQDNLIQNTSVLWSTFFLGMFELMCDTSGEGWVKHFLHGTAALLQHRGPAAHLSGAGRRFFLTTRVFEICRALVYSSESFLAHQDWGILMKNMWLGAQGKNWHPKEALFDLMIACGTLSIRAMKLVHSMNKCPEIANGGTLSQLAQEGLSLQSSLFAWRESAQKWSVGAANSASQDLQMTIALSYYHAVSIFLSGTFDYHYSHWSGRRIATPILSSAEVQAHVTIILEVVGQALKEGVLSGILFFFPLRVAGARARTSEQRREISRLLNVISVRGFVVADAFVMDLDELWDSTLME